MTSLSPIGRGSEAIEQTWPLAFLNPEKASTVDNEAFVDGILAESGGVHLATKRLLSWPSSLRDSPEFSR
jgi:hypothetical protein